MTESFEDVRERVRDFIDHEVIPAEPVMDRGDGAATAQLESLKTEAKSRGIWALGHPADIGGGGRTFMETALLNEVIGRSFYGQKAVGTWSMQDSLMLKENASDEQRERWLKPLVAGEIRSSVGLTEPEVAGSDPTLIASTAVLDGDEWVVNAHKWFTTGANIAAFTTVFAVTDPDADRHRRVSAIIVPTDSPGYQVLRAVPTLGTERTIMGDHCEIRLTDVRVPVTNLLGERGNGFVIGQRRLGPGRIFHAMRWLGQMERAFEHLVEYSQRRYVHGSMLSEKGEIQAFIAESAMDIFYHRAAVLEAARAVDSGSLARMEISMIKVRGAKLLHDVIDRAIQAHGALGVTPDTPLEAMYRRARYARIYDGPDEVHRYTLARLIGKDISKAPWYDV
ncbi:MAG TPA: acyl-CoA dehydrogenase family protein [Nocardioides sp.]|jgi:alkylation response protein AidB-like acyl-CoA dehydrogenase|uniref:acyl-CoA dehydrogenase family protein n=1 Tax=Nocardioides sp. TaxID=35761 RepID=UPI002E31B013|nr:acyl-CoA dehydrogenase family protein [Nocardioides sp.]HEX3930006.1 acyl-CoA dehydrogenase family protein [Nocardioides sp.]